MFALFRSPMFLMMTLLSPLSMAGQLLDSRKTGTQKFADSIEKFGAAAGEAQGRGRAGAARRAGRADPPVARPRRPRPPGDAAHPRPVGPAAPRRRVPAHPAGHRHGGVEGHGRARRRPARTTCARPRRRPSPGTTGCRPARSASTSPSSACSACTASSPTCGRCARRSSSRRSPCTAPRTSSSSSSRASRRASARGPSGCPHTRSATSPISARHVVEDEIGRRRDDPRAGLGRPAAHGDRRPRRPSLAVDPRRPRRERQRRCRARVAAPRPVPAGRDLRRRRRRVRCPRAPPGEGDDGLRSPDRRHVGAVDGVVHRSRGRRPSTSSWSRPTPA